MQALPWAFGTDEPEHTAQKFGVKHELHPGMLLTQD